MKINVNPVRGTKDYLPTEMEVRQNIINIILEIYKKNGFQQIKTPILENIELLKGGDDGDNQKLMFKTIKRGEKLNLSARNLTENDLCEEGLRYDLTVPLARFFCKNREMLSFPFKSIQIDESFRAERPQRGRNRQFTQCDIDILGDSSIVAETEIILTTLQAYKAIGFKNITLKINDRRILNQIILYSGFTENDITNICICLDKLDKIGLNGVKQELLDRQYSNTNIDILLQVIQDIQINGIKCLDKYSVNSSVIKDLNDVLNTVQNNIDNNYIIVFDISIVRGQGYYTGIVFEAYTNDFDYSGALGGGGRYDKMIEKISGTPVPAVGGAIGLDPITLLILENNITYNNKKTIALLYDNNNTLSDLFKIKLLLIDQYNVSIFKYPKNMNAMLNKLLQNNFYGYVYLRDCLQTNNINSIEIKQLKNKQGMI